MALTAMMTSAAEDTNSAGYILPYCKLTSEQAAADPFKAFIHGRCHGVVEAIGKIHQAHMVGDRALCTDMPGSVTDAQALQAACLAVQTRALILGDAHSLTLPFGVAAGRHRGSNGSIRAAGR